MNTDIKNCGLRDTGIRVDLSAIAENMEHICQLVGKETAVAAVVKANGYGHGARAIAPTLIEHGAALLAVATLEEAALSRRSTACIRPVCSIRRQLTFASRPESI